MKAVMRSLVRKAKKMDISDLEDVAAKVFPEIRTNLSKGGILKSVAGIGDYSIVKNYSWPDNYYGGLMNGVWYCVPRTLDSQVKWLHKKAFSQKKYDLTKRAEKINDEIIDNSGVY